MSDAFARRLDPYRREILVHCYRMAGSADDAEDLVQETMLRAWRARDRYDESVASLRTWLYKIATNVCLTWVQGRPRRELPTSLVAAGHDPHAPLTPALDVAWLQPLPDETADPADHAVRRSSVRLALIAAMQLLPPRQRAVFLLRDVLGYPAAETAELLGTSVASANSALQRARAIVAAACPQESAVGEPADAEVAAAVRRYVDAFEAADVTALVGLLTGDIVLEMPPVALWYRGAGLYARFMERVFAMRGRSWRMLPSSANGQPALAAYVGDGTTFRLHTVHVLTVSAQGISRITVFQDPQVLRRFPAAPA
ncbi:RNA polymerase sigma factor [Catellatospora sp. TT07R-123]|uniref:sigma-70 family RNA polymerase sigma factor n=1 Tax=Catellatospora sp. TT07R-123 TaxID=2733863 RepID=UPI001B2C6114|nr:sigma-70 family RNA polymerase sigma factor [Catellatospora sp. TT07R-123]GHJ47963.1 RNA polymerase sigma factor [Catellatospora sp. TT07R-123]